MTQVVIRPIMVPEFSGVAAHAGTTVVYQRGTIGCKYRFL